MSFHTQNKPFPNTSCCGPIVISSRARFRISRSAAIAEIKQWLDALARTQNVIDGSGPIFRRWAQLMHRRADHHLEDALIAATALVHGLIVATRNVRDFEPFDVGVINPFASTPTRGDYDLQSEKP